MLSGCGGVEIPAILAFALKAKTGVDVVSYIATEKSITDHGLSAITDQDCALHYFVFDDDSQICRDDDSSAIVIHLSRAEVDDKELVKSLNEDVHAIIDAYGMEISEKPEIIRVGEDNYALHYMVNEK